MHKDLNSIKGGNKKMMEGWAGLGVQGPVQLANRDNDAVIDGIADAAETLTPAEQRAMDITACGGVKAASIAGAIFNNKDDKKTITICINGTLYLLLEGTSNSL